ncbi:Hypothetical predicted protein, partial [Paramuricea clavata]
IRSQREAFISSIAKTALDCVLFCFEQKTCKSFNYADYTSGRNGEENCELHNEINNDDGNSLQFLKDDRYTFYQIPRASHEQENKKKTDYGIEIYLLANTPSLNRSCLDHFNHGSKTSGYYTILDLKEKARTVYCDMESEPGSVWTLIMSFTRENKDVNSFRSKAMYERSATNPSTPNWIKYRMSYSVMHHVKRTTHWRVTCSFPQYGVNINIDYVRAAFADFDLMGTFWRKCKKVSYISVMEQSCLECTAHWSQGNVSSPHIAADDEVVCDIKSDKSGNNYFGVRSQRKVFIGLRAKTSIHCAVFCLDEKTCKSLNYAEYTSVKDGQENCELHNETKNDDGAFLKDDRYTFYHIPGASHEQENKQKTENVTEQAHTPPLNRSCLDHFNHGSKTSGNYTILDWEEKARTVYCDMESEPGSVWTLIMSFTRENKDLKAFRKRAMYQSAAKNKDAPNWSAYRMGSSSLVALKNMTTHWRITCSFPQYRVDIKTHYVRAVFADFDLLSEFSGECKNVSYVSVMGQSCSKCTVQWTQIDNFTPHIAAMQNDSACDIKSDNSGYYYFGGYYTYNPKFRCTETPKSTTNYWFGSYV